jgi:hypothetical protein
MVAVQGFHLVLSKDTFRTPRSSVEKYETSNAYASAKGSRRSETNCSLQFAHLAGFGPAGLGDLQNYLSKVFPLRQQSVGLGGAFHWQHMSYHRMQVAL